MEYRLLGNHPAIEKTRELITLVSETTFNVLLLGETGTGKEVVARLLHAASLRRNKRFIKVNCAALPFALLESELFGFEKGAFTGADRMKPGKFELASGGVIYLDEIGDMPLIVQVKLLEVLQGGEFSRLGGTENIKVDSWVIASTNHDLEEDIRKKLFREDLYYRLNIIKIELPPLRERREDIMPLADHFAEKYRTELEIEGSFHLDDDLRELFLAYHWPGNARELSSVVLRVMVGENPEEIKGYLIGSMMADGLIAGRDNGQGSSDPAVGSHGEDPKTHDMESLKKINAKASQEIEKRVISTALGLSGWNKREAARMLKISYKSLFNKINSLHIGS
jgi:two-component system, NtrC family, response regulator AtoC